MFLLKKYFSHYFNQIAIFKVPGFSGNFYFNKVNLLTRADDPADNRIK